MLSHPVPGTSSRASEPDHVGVAIGLIALGLAGLLTELLSATSIPRLVLHLTVFSFGVVRLIRCRRADRRRQPASLVMTSPAGGGQVTMSASS